MADKWRNETDFNFVENAMNMNGGTSWRECEICERLIRAPARYCSNCDSDVRIMEASELPVGPKNL